MRESKLPIGACLNSVPVAFAASASIGNQHIFGSTSEIKVYGNGKMYLFNV